MRRTLEVISLGLCLLGLELATGTPSLTITRLRETFADPFGSVGEDGVQWTSLAGIGLMVLAVLVAGVTLAVRYRQGAIQDHVRYPECGARTKRVRRTARHRILGWVMGKALSARHCGDCGWKGLSYLH